MDQQNCDIEAKMLARQQYTYNMVGNLYKRMGIDRSSRQEAEVPQEFFYT